MSDGKWNGGTANREWSRPGSRHYPEQLTDAEVNELYLAKADESFFCETCGGKHPLREHQACRSTP